MNFASNKKKRLFYQKRAFELSKKKRKTSPSTKSQQKISDRFNFFIDILNTNKKEQETKNKISKKVGVSENKENNPKNIDDIFNELKAIHKNTENDIITLEDINNSLLEDIENTITSNNNDNSNNSKLSNETIVSNLPKEERISNNEIKRDKYITRRKILTLKEHKIIQHNIDLILNKENDSAPNKINKKEIDIVNQFQLNALGYINFYAKKRKELIHQNKTNSEHQNIHNLDEEELERLIDQEWITLEKRIKNKHIEDVVRKQTKIAKKNLKNKKTNKNSGTDNSFQTIIENENENENEISSNQQLTKNIPIIPDSELIMTELKEYTELNLLNEMYNHSKQLSIPYFSVIKHPPNPFSIYTKDTINTVIKQNPSKTRNEALKIVAKNWKNENKDKKRNMRKRQKNIKMIMKI
ncbi:hypothetical protein BCR36DRAFT_184968 [Piromyces finnis]|uniref:HMG box domain-containing protein n=1 Tax=Piromyces finnis TaxID=1754191 RepID=A0A1Y1VGV1_9FUNG|nr:hypothetical protein BCR36DRAFT_184968 [Piromyces finnis]|eukprot:ORX55370.1 hypothetical protein BCR36DRAFT_184968 [Piromyces finnis]